MSARDEISERPGYTTTVAKFGDGSVTSTDGWTLGCDTDGLDFPPGTLIEQWGRGIGYTVRGLAIGGRVFWYRTEAEDERRHLDWVADKDRQDRERFEADRARLDAAYDSLPDTFKARIDKFRRTNPDFRWKFEAYEMMCCTDALKIARYCSIHRLADGDEEPTAAENIDAFYSLPYEEQKKAGIDEGHSGNSFGFAVRLARWWVTDPGLVEQDHGALTPLVGCEEYGCPHPATFEGEVVVTPEPPKAGK